MINVLNYIRENIVCLTPILATGAFAFVIILERTHALAWDYAFPYFDAFFEKIRYLVLVNRLNEALAICEQLSAKPVVRIVREGLFRAHQPEPLIETGLELIAHEVQEKFRARTPLLVPAAMVAILLGLSGSLWTFMRSVRTSNGESLIIHLLPALSITLAGFAIAIPCLIFHAFLKNHSQRLIAQTELAAIRMRDLLKQHYYAEPPPSGGPPLMPPRSTRSTKARGEL